MNRWFRFYDSALDDPKVQRLSGDLFKTWVNLLCLASRHDGVLPSDADTAFALRKSVPVLRGLLDDLHAAGLIDITETGASPHNWNARQYKSDVSNERVKRHRERQRNVTRNGVVTPSETETETEADTETTSKDVVGAKAPKATRKTKLPADWKPSEEQLAYATEQGCSDPADTAERFRLHHQSKGTLGQDWNLGFQYWCRNEKTFRKATPEDRGEKRAREIQQAIENSRESVQ